MTCNKCGTATKCVESTGGIESGRFREEYECVRGHKGTIAGNAEEPPQQWDRYGTVFGGI